MSRVWVVERWVARIGMIWLGIVIFRDFWRGGILLGEMRVNGLCLKKCPACVLRSHHGVLPRQVGFRGIGFGRKNCVRLEVLKAIVH